MILPRQLSRPILGLVGAAALLTVLPTPTMSQASAESQTPAESQAPAESQENRLKSPGKARLVSAVGTVAPVAIGVAGEGLSVLVPSGLVLGPAAGYLYADMGTDAVRPIVVRGVILGAAVGAAHLICAKGDCDMGFWGSETGESLLPALLVVGGGVAVVMFLAAKDIVDVGTRVRSRNREVTAVSVQPVYFQGARATGIGVTWRH